jgi:hypothetical protein
MFFSHFLNPNVLWTKEIYERHEGIIFETWHYIRDIYEQEECITRTKDEEKRSELARHVWWMDAV